MPKLSSDEYFYTVTVVNGDCYSVVTQSSTGKTKRFFQAGHSDAGAMTQHLDSLTDTLFSQWFATTEHKKTKKKE